MQTDLAPLITPNVERNFMRHITVETLPPLADAKVERCWLWTAGYRMRVGYAHALPHRVSFEIFRGSPPPGAWILHGCPNPSCVHPLHLILFQPQDHPLRWRSPAEVEARRFAKQLRRNQRMNHKPTE